MFLQFEKNFQEIFQTYKNKNSFLSSVRKFPPFLISFPSPSYFSLFLSFLTMTIQLGFIDEWNCMVLSNFVSFLQEGKKFYGFMNNKNKNISSSSLENSNYYLGKLVYLLIGHKEKILREANYTNLKIEEIPEGGEEELDLLNELQELKVNTTTIPEKKYIIYQEPVFYPIPVGRIDSFDMTSSHFRFLVSSEMTNYLSQNYSLSLLLSSSS